MGASTPHFALHIRNRIRNLVAGLPPDHPARVEGEREIARLETLAFGSERRGPIQSHERGLPSFPRTRQPAAGSPAAHGRLRYPRSERHEEEQWPWEFHVLVVANVTATSDELLAALKEREKQGACRFTLVMPRSGTGSAERLEEALEAMRARGPRQG